MTGMKIVVPTTFTDPTLLILRDDPLFYDAGSVFLLETNHPLSPMTVAATSGAVVPNLTSSSLKLLQASLPENDYHGALLANGDFLTLPNGKFEKSAKNGLHLIASQAASGSNSRYARVRIPAAAKTYLTANTGHTYYWSVWDRVTRQFGNTGLTGHGDFGAGQFWFSKAADDSVRPVDATRKGWRADGAVGLTASGTGSRTATGPLFQNISRNPVSVPVASSGNSIASENVVYVGENGAKMSASIVFYRAYLEDLTVSGRTYAQVDALDFAEYTKQVLTAGGRYYDDTVPTAPSTFP
jgi:hypothetical protein